MLTKTKIALAAVLVAATASVATAQEFDPNLGNRYPTYNGPAVQGPRALPPPTFASAIAATPTRAS